MNADWNELQRKLGHVFGDSRLLERALTHRSYAADHYERLEFLGDSVLNLAVSDLLYLRLTRAPEGDLSRTRANLVKQDTLVQIANRLGVSSCLQLGEGEVKSGGRQRPSILADAVEALLGAVYLDAGYDRARAVAQQLFGDVKVSTDMPAMDKDAKTALQEWLQGRRQALPTYRVVEIAGAAHQQTFTVACEVAGQAKPQIGQGPSRRAAEQAAAAAMLQQLLRQK